jgi:hypothetical protein
VSQDFFSGFFSRITIPQAPDNNIRIISNFFENSRRYSQVKVHHRCQRHRWWWWCTGVVDTGGKFATGINDTGSSPCVVDTGGKFATGVNDTGGKFAAGVNDAGGNLPPVSTTPAANNWNNIRLQNLIVNLQVTK